MDDVERLVDELQQKVIKRYRAGLKDNGWAIVRREAVDKMEDAAYVISYEFDDGNNRHYCLNDPGEVWAAMLKEGEMKP